jgi:hypothetical protein
VKEDRQKTEERKIDRDREGVKETVEKVSGRERGER